MIAMHLDVLALPSDSLITRQPSPEGRRLWNTLFEAYKGRMVIIADYGTDEEILKQWLIRENFKASIIHVSNGFARDGYTERSESLWWVNTSIGKPIWYVDVDADSCAAAVTMGIPTLLVAIPHFQRPEWVDKPSVRPWDSVVSALEEQALRKNEMSWGDE